MVFRLAVQRLWVSGALGALFFSIARNLPGHLKEFSLNFDAEYTLSVFLKYLFVSWMVAYFLVSAMDNEGETAKRRWRDLFFDIGQSVSALVAAYFLGFLIPAPNYGITGYMWAFGIIAGICLVALSVFGSEARKGVNKLRATGLGLAAIGFTLCFVGQDWGISLLYAITLVQFILWLVLLDYLRIGYDVEPLTEDQIEADKKRKNDDKELKRNRKAEQKEQSEREREKKKQAKKRNDDDCENDNEK